MFEQASVFRYVGPHSLPLRYSIGLVRFIPLEIYTNTFPLIQGAKITLDFCYDIRSIVEITAPIDFVLIPIPAKNPNEMTVDNILR